MYKDYHRIEPYWNPSSSKQDIIKAIRIYDKKTIQENNKERYWYEYNDKKINTLINSNQYDDKGIKWFGSPTIISNNKTIKILNEIYETKTLKFSYGNDDKKITFYLADLFTKCTIDMFNDITPTIKNKYVYVNDLQLFAQNLEHILNIATTSINKINENKINLHNLCPVFDNIKKFLNNNDIGSISLVSKQFYNSMVNKYTQFKIDLYIIGHYLCNPIYDYDVNIKFKFNNSKNIPINKINSTTPINIKYVKLRQLRLKIGEELYFKKYNVVFFNEDLKYIAINYGMINFTNTLYCVFCKDNKFEICDDQIKLYDHDCCKNKIIDKYNFCNGNKKFKNKFQLFVYPNVEHNLKEYILPYKDKLISTHEFSYGWSRLHNFYNPSYFDYMNHIYANNYRYSN